MTGGRRIVLRDGTVRRVIGGGPGRRSEVRVESAGGGGPGVVVGNGVVKGVRLGGGRGGNTKHRDVMTGRVRGR